MRLQKSIEKSTAENIEVADWGTDLYGNSTHRINEKGAIDSSVTEMFGCEMEKSIPEFVRNFTDKMGLGEFIRVPIRKNGLTGSGNSFMCHYNSMLLAMSIGGHRLSGFTVHREFVEEHKKYSINFLNEYAA